MLDGKLDIGNACCLFEMAEVGTLLARQGGMDSHNNQIAEVEMQRHLSAMVEQMPPFPESVHQVMGMTSDINCSPKDLVVVIERDPVLTMKILKMVNSAFFALSREVSSVQHALVYLGMNTIKNLAVAIATVDALPRSSIPELPMSAFLTYSLATAAIAQRLARERLQLRDASDHFVAGLLHDFGKAVLVQFESTTYALVLQKAHRDHRELSEVEAEEMGICSAEVGGMLAESWQLPQELVDSIRLHGTCCANSPDLVLTVSAANLLARAMALGDNGNPADVEFPDFMAERFHAALPELIAQLQDLPEEVRQIQGTVGASS